MAAEGARKTAAALVIGNELLSGKVHETNLMVLAIALRELGIRLVRAVTVLDDIETIAREVQQLSRSHDWVFTSGGVGPTHDDVTIGAVARAFEVPVVQHPELEGMLRAHYGDRCTDGHLFMARVPEGAALVSSPAVRWPAVVMHNVWVLPGIPEAFQMKLTIVRESLLGGAPFVSRAVFTKMDEGDLKPLLDAVVLAHPEVEVGSYPKWVDPTYRTKLTFDGSDRLAVDLAVQDFLALLPAGEPQRIE